MSALRSRVNPRAFEPDQVTAELPAGDFVEFWRAGASAKGGFQCVECNFVLATLHLLPRCLRCGAEYWERAEADSFELEATESKAGTDLNAVAGAFRGAFYGVVLGFVVWLGAAGVAFGLFRLIHG